MNLFSVSSSPNLRLHYFYRKIRMQLFSNSPLYSRISSMGDPNLTIVPVLDQWFGEGKFVNKMELLRVISGLMSNRRFKHALEVSLWMSNQRGIPVAPIDVAMRLKLIFKLFGLEEVENYLNKIPESLRTYHVYLALLNCYTIAKSVDKAEAIMHKARDSGYASKPIWYDLMMDLHYKLGNTERLEDLLNEMEAKGISYDQFTLSVCLKSCASASDAVGMDKIVKIMESDRPGIVDWRTYVIAVQGFLRMGLHDKAVLILNKLERLTTKSKEDTILFGFLFTLYAEAGKKKELYRIWNLYKQKRKFANKAYSSMMRSLMKFDDIEGMEKIFEEWESRTCLYDFRIPNLLMDAYCTNGHLEKAEALITKGISKGGHPVVTTWCHLAGGYLKKNQVPEAVEALKKAISIFPPRFMSQKDSLIASLEYLENGDRVEKAEKLINLIRVRGISWEAASDDLWGLAKDKELQFSRQNQSSEGILVTEDELK